MNKTHLFEIFFMGLAQETREIFRFLCSEVSVTHLYAPQHKIELKFEIYEQDTSIRDHLEDLNGEVRINQYDDDGKLKITTVFDMEVISGRTRLSWQADDVQKWIVEATGNVKK